MRRIAGCRTAKARRTGSHRTIAVLTQRRRGAERAAHHSIHRRVETQRAQSQRTIANQSHRRHRIGMTVTAASVTRNHPTPVTPSEPSEGESRGPLPVGWPLNPEPPPGFGESLDFAAAAAAPLGMTLCADRVNQDDLEAARRRGGAAGLRAQRAGGSGGLDEHSCSERPAGSPVAAVPNRRRLRRPRPLPCDAVVCDVFVSSCLRAFVPSCLRGCDVAMAFAPVRLNCDGVMFSASLRLCASALISAMVAMAAMASAISALPVVQSCDGAAASRPSRFNDATLRWLPASRAGTGPPRSRLT